MYVREGGKATKLTEEQVKAIKYDTPREFFTATEVAREYNVSPRTIRAIWDEEQWKDL